MQIADLIYDHSQEDIFKLFSKVFLFFPPKAEVLFSSRYKKVRPPFPSMIKKGGGRIYNRILFFLMEAEAEEKTCIKLGFRADEEGIFLFLHNGKRSFGLVASARAISSFLCLPYGKLHARLFLSSSKPKMSSSSFARLRIFLSAIK